MIDTPECDKLSAVHEFSQKIGEFVDWLASEKELHLGRWVELDKDEAAKHDEKEAFVPARDNIQNLLAEFFGIDMNKLEEERRAILNDICTERENRIKTLVQWI